MPPLIYQANDGSLLDVSSLSQRRRRTWLVSSGDRRLQENARVSTSNHYGHSLAWLTFKFDSGSQSESADQVLVNTK